jgi:hypothetical protein
MEEEEEEEEIQTPTNCNVIGQGIAAPLPLLSPNSIIP